MTIGICNKSIVTIFCCAAYGGYDIITLMKNKVILCVSLALGLMLQAEALTDGNWQFSVADGEATLTGYSGTGPEDFVLPSSVESGGVSYPVTAVGSSAFSGKGWIKSILVRVQQQVVVQDAADA